MKYNKKIILFSSLITISLLIPFVAKSLSIQNRESYRPSELKEQQNIDNFHSDKLKEKDNIAIRDDSSRPKIQMAILLDSSNSMDGLIEQTRTQIWKIVNALTTVKKNGQTPILEVSLYHYGNNTLPSEEGFLRLLSQFTPELDLVSEKLFTINTNGGQEYAGWVINSAMNQLNWSNNNEDFRVIFIAGNEPFDQGNKPWQEAIALAKNKDVLVNTIYCGDAESAESTLWARGATESAGSYFNINQNEAIVAIPTPYDDEITRLNQQLNDTYIPYGEQGRIGKQRQAAQDSNATRGASMGAAVSRAITKSSGFYNNSSWDLVDAAEKEEVDLDKLENEALPEEMRSMSLQQRKEYLEEATSNRQNIQSQIANLSQQRADYIRKKAASRGKKDTVDYVMIEALRKQLAAKGFSLN